MITRFCMRLMSLVLFVFIILFQFIGDVYSQTESTHPLINTLWDTSQKRPLTTRDLIEQLTKADHIIIGEVHGHAPHQERTAFLLGALANREIYPALVLEMLDPAGAERVAAHRRDNPEDPSALGALLRWNEQGWPSYSHYQPMMERAYAAKLPILGFENPQDETTERKRLETDKKAAPLWQAWTQAMDTAHCGLLKPEDAKNKGALQVRRDQLMAKALTQAQAEHGKAILLAGLSHIRRDRGVPAYLPSSQRTHIIALVEVDERQSPAAYIPKSLNTTRPYDTIWFTPSRGKDNTCDRLKKKGLIGS